jgi:uracil-DNA glycosylase family 4
MSDVPLSAEEWQRQARQHLESLRVAGLEWLPATAAPAAPVPAQAPTAVVQPALFEEASEPAPAPTTESLTLEQRRQGLDLLAQTVHSCMRCPALCSTRTQTVFADGEAGAELCFIGEAPGEDEDAQGKPFVGAAGQLLNRIIAACGLKREEVYICNTLKCRPPRNRPPTPEELSNCREYLTRQLELVQPRFICALGNSAAKTVLNTTLSMARLRGRFHDYRGIPVLCTYHPSFLLPHRDPSKKKEVWEDMQLLMARMGRTIPQR